MSSMFALDVLSDATTGPCEIASHDRFARLVEIEEQCLVQEFVAHFAVEALDIAVLRGLARRGVMPIDLVIPSPGDDGM